MRCENFLELQRFLQFRSAINAAGMAGRVPS